MTHRSETIRNKGQAVLDETLPGLHNPIWDSLNRQQRLMVRGWLGKGRVATVDEALNRIRKRIVRDSAQGKKIDSSSPWELGDPLP